MSINVNFKKNIFKNPSKIDLIPVFFDYNGEAKIEEYFHHKTSSKILNEKIKEKIKLKKNYLFGRYLLGKNFKLESEKSKLKS